MNRENEQLLLLVIRDLTVFRRIWPGVHGFLSFENKQKNPKNRTIKTDVLGVFVTPSLFLPDKLVQIDSFGVSGLWTLCQIDPACFPKRSRRQKLDFLAQTLLNERSVNLKAKGDDNQIFFPGFKEGISENIVEKTLRAIQKKYSCKIKSFFFFHHKTNAFRLEKL